MTATKPRTARRTTASRRGASTPGAWTRGAPTPGAWTRGVERLLAENARRARQRRLERKRAQEAQEIPEYITLLDGSRRRVEDVYNEMKDGMPGFVANSDLSAEGATPEDFLSEACIALLQAIRSYDPSHGVDLVPWVLRRVGFRLRDFQRYMSVYKRRAEGVDIDHPGNERYLAVASDGRSPYSASRHEEDIALSLDIREAIGRLPRAQRDVLHCIFFERMTEPETARHLRMDEHKVRYCRRAALERLRRILPPLENLLT